MYTKIVRYLFTFLLLAGVMAAGNRAHAQVAPADTLRLSLKDAESRFLQNNLQLLIQKYNVNIAQAQIITAKLFPNPDFNFSNGIHATQVNNAGSQQAMSLTQVIQTAGKRNKNIQLAQIEAQQSNYQFFDLLRTLRYTLRNDFYTIYFQEQSARVYTEEISSLGRTLNVFKRQFASGNIAQKEVLRIQSQLYSLQGEYNNLLTTIDTTQSEFKLLIRANPNTYVIPVYDFDTDKESVSKVPYQHLLDSAIVNRYDLKAAQSQVQYSDVNLRLQKALAVPDFSLGVSYDKLGSYGNNFIGAGIEFNLPFFNRNQGGIKQARIAVDQSRVQLQAQQGVVQTQVATNYQLATRLETLYNSFDTGFKGDFNRLIKGVFENYQKRNISLLEFLDFYDAYKNTTVQLNNIQLNKVSSLEQLNYVTGTPFFNKQ